MEADRTAAALMACAGYDPAALPNVLRTLQNDRSNDQGLALLASIHPPFKERIDAVQPEVAKAAALVRPASPDKGKTRYATLLASLRSAARK